MTKSNITEYDKVAANNTDVQDVPLGENQMYPSDVNNAFREIMADLAAVNDGTVSLTSPSFAAASLTGNLSFGDNDKAIFGAGSDLQIYHDGSNSYIQDAGTGNLLIRGANVEITTAIGTKYFEGAANIARLYHTGNEKLATTSTGIDVTGEVTADSINFNGLSPTVAYDFNGDGSVTSADGLDYLQMGSGAATGVDISSVDTITPSWSALSGSIYSDNKFRIMSARGNSTDALRIVASLTAEGHGDTTIIGNVEVDGVDTQIITGLGISGDNINLLSDGSKRLNIASNGDIFFYEDTGTTAKLEWLASDETLKFADNSKAVFGSSSDLQIFHSGTNSHVKDAGTGSLLLQGDSLYLMDSAGSNTYLYGNSGNGGVELRYGNSAKLNTIATGIDVTGTVGADQIVLDRTAGGTIQIKKSGTNSAFVGEVEAGLGSGDGLLLYTYTGTDRPIIAYTNGVERLRIDSSGNVNINGTNNRPLAITSFDTVSAGAGWDLDATSSNGVVTMSTGGTERLRITSGGDLLISTTSNVIANASTSVGTAINAGLIESARAGVVAQFNRQTSDGAIIEIQRSGTAVGSIGVVSGDNFYIAGNSSHAGGLGIGTSSIYPVTDTGASDSGTNDLGNSGAYFRRLYIAQGIWSPAGSLPLHIDGSEKARLDSSGNLLVGKTSASSATVGFQAGQDGFIAATRASGQPLVLNRTTNDGIIADFRKDSTTVGSIGAAIGNAYFAGSSTGITFGSANLYPTNASGTKSSNALTLGSASNRFKDLYLGGTANAVTINTDGPTGTGNGIVMAASGWPYKGRIGMNGTSGGKQYWTANYNLNTSSVDSASYYSTYIENSAQNGIVAFGTSSAANTAPSERMRIDSSGRVGIGTSSPASSLHIVNSGLVNQLRISNTTADATTKYGTVLGSHYTNSEEPITGMLLTSSSSSTGGTVSIGGGISSANAVNNILFYTAANNTTLIGTERMRIDSSGRVGIGTSSPSQNLHVSSSGDTVVRITSADGNGAFLDLGDASDPDGGRIVYDSGSNLTFSTSSTERVRIKSDGKVGIGTSSPLNDLHIAGPNPGIRIDENDKTSNFGLILFNSNALRIRARADTTRGSIRFEGQNDTDILEYARFTNTGAFGLGTNNPTEKLHVSGNILATGNITAYSDERLKSDIKTLDGSKVYEMRGVSYIKDGEASSGVIAQELQKVAPELVSESGEYLSVAYGNLVGYLIEAVKELKAEVEELKNASSD